MSRVKKSGTTPAAQDLPSEIFDGGAQVTPRLSTFSTGKVDRVLNSLSKSASGVPDPVARLPLRALVTPIDRNATKKSSIAISDLIPPSASIRPMQSTQRYQGRASNAQSSSTRAAVARPITSTAPARRAPATPVTVVKATAKKAAPASRAAAKKAPAKKSLKPSTHTKTGSAASTGFLPGPTDPQLPKVASATLLPTKLSPSRAKDFKQCPRLFFYKTILKLPTPGTVATLKGVLAHAVLEMIFIHPRQERTKDLALSYIAPAWTVLRNPSADLSDIDNEYEKNIRMQWGAFTGEELDYKAVARADDFLSVAPPSSPAEREVLEGARLAVLGYFNLENPQAFDPVAREMKIAGSVGVEPDGGEVHGIIDRLDSYLSNHGQDRVIISDYKTGKVPRDAYLDEAFFAMRGYALLYRQSTGVTPYSLRLLYIADGQGPASIITQKLDDQLLDETEREYKNIWVEIRSAARNERWETKSGPLCPWCPFQNICPEFNKAVLPIEDKPLTLL